jgi:hypothetical protein
MVEKQNAIITKPDKHCSECKFGKQYVALTGGRKVNENGDTLKWYLIEPTPIGQTRNCYGFIEKILFDPKIFIYPKEDDTCVNPRRFKARNNAGK